MIRRSYLSIAPPPRRNKYSSHPGGPNPVHHRPQDADHLTDEQRDTIDAEAKSTWREIHAAVNHLSQAEQLRHETDISLRRKRQRRRGLGALTQWAAGGSANDTSPEEQAVEKEALDLKEHREGVMWFLQKNLQECGNIQSLMMESRISREMEKSKSVLSKAKGLPSTFSAMEQPNDGVSATNGNTSSFELSAGLPPGYLEEKTEGDPNPSHMRHKEIDPEQVELFAEENRDMLKHYQDQLGQVR